MFGCQSVCYITTTFPCCQPQCLHHYSSPIIFLPVFLSQSATTLNGFILCSLSFSNFLPTSTSPRMPCPKSCHHWNSVPPWWVIGMQLPNALINFSVSIKHVQLFQMISAHLNNVNYKTNTMKQSIIPTTPNFLETSGTKDTRCVCVKCTFCQYP